MQIFSAFLTPMHTVSNTVTGKCWRNCSQTWEFLAVQGWKTGHAVGTIAIKSNYLVVNGFFKWDRCSWRNFCYFYRVQCCWYALIWSIDRVELAAPSCPPAASTFILLNTDLHCKVNAMWWDHESTSKDYLRGFVFFFWSINRINISWSFRYISGYEEDCKGNLKFYVPGIDLQWVFY